MNFKYITKIAAATLLFASTSMFAVFVSKGPLYLHIENKTDYNFNIKQKDVPVRPLGDEIKAHKNKTFSQLPFKSSSSTYIELTSGDILLELIVIDELGTNVRAMLIPRAGTDFTPLYEMVRSESTAGYEYHIFLTLEGDKENGFADSSLRLEAGIPKA